jgi:hypothetical protein
MSDPLRRYGASRILDGINLLKAGHEIPYADDVKQITSGEWSQRRAAFARFFGSSPISDEYVSQLERIRNLRNNFAHGFGRSLEVPLPSTAALGPVEGLRHETFLKYLGVISKCAALIDKLLLTEVIGNFELLHLYHVWKAAPRNPQEKNYSEGRALQRTLNRTLTNVKLEFCTDLIKYYDAQ